MKEIRIKVVVQAKKENVPGWPHINYGYDKKTEEIMSSVREYNDDAKFDVVKYTSPQQAEEAFEEDKKKYDGILLLLMTNWVKIDNFYAKHTDEMPIAIAGICYCGSGSLLESTIPMIRENNLPIPYCSSTNNMDIARLARTLVVNAKLKRTTVLVIKNVETQAKASKAKKCNSNSLMAEFNAVTKDQREVEAAKRFGCKFIVKSSKDLMDEFDAVSDEAAEPIVKKWTNGALGVVEPSAKDIVEGAKLYIALKKMVKENKANAVTVDCLSLSYQDEYGKNRHMYPCLSHFQMNNDGELGVCEADIDATMSCLISLYLAKKQGFVSDPVIDTSSDQIIYAHCVACRKVYGTNDARSCDYYIRSHAEDQLGASVQVIFPTGEKLTTFTMSNVNGWGSVHSAESVGNAGGDAGCRSKLVAKCNARAIMDNWMPQWHRVTVFGDYRTDIMNLFKLKGMRIVEEDK